MPKGLEMLKQKIRRRIWSFNTILIQMCRRIEILMCRRIEILMCRRIRRTPMIRRSGRVWTARILMTPKHRRIRMKRRRMRRRNKSQLCKTTRECKNQQECNRKKENLKSNNRMKSNSSILNQTVETTGRWESRRRNSRSQTTQRNRP